MNGRVNLPRAKALQKRLELQNTFRGNGTLMSAVEEKLDLGGLR